MGAISGVGLSADNAGSALKNFALAGVAVAAAALTDMVVQSVNMAGEFQASMTRLTTTAGESTANLAMVSAGILKISVDTGTSAQDIAKSMYTIESGGFHGAAGLQVMTVAAQAARMEQANLTDVSRALVTVMTDYHMPASQAANATNELVTAVSLGRANLEDMSKAMASVLPIAAASGVSFAQVGAAVAVMTNAGNSAQISTKWLANAITALSAPNAVAVKSMTAVGLTAQELSDTLRYKGLGPAIQEVTDAVGKKFPAGSVEAVEALKKIMGGVTGYKVALELGGKSMKAYTDDVNKIAASAKIGGTTIQGWSDVQGNFNFKMDQAKAAANAFMITLGSELLPVFGKILDKITPIITGFIDWESKTHTIQNAVKGLVDALVGMVQGGANVVSFFKNNELAMDGLKSVLIAFALVVTPLVVLALQALAVSAWAAIVPILPFVAAIAILALAIFGLIELIKNWGAIQDWLTGKTKESQLQQQELNQKNALKTIQISEQQKRGVLANMEDERTQLIAKIKGMADSADKSREQIRLSALNAQIATTKGDLKELDSEKAQHLKILKDLQSQDPQIREQTKIAAIQKQVDTKNGVLKHLDEEKTQLIAKITNEKDSSTKTRDLMKLDAINKQIDTTTGAIKALDNEKTQHAAKLKNMISSDLEARKGWYDRANDSLTAWVDSQDKKIADGYKVANDATTNWFSSMNSKTNKGYGDLDNTIGTGVRNFLTTIKNGYDSANNATTAWVNSATATIETWPGRVASALGSFGSMLVGIIQRAGAWATSAAISAGSSIVQGIANGIEGAIGYVVGAIGDVTSIIAAHLPHSPAKMGPLVGLEDMGAQISKQLAVGMGKSIPTIQAGMNLMLSPLVHPQPAIALPSSSYSAQPTQQTGQGTGQPIILQVDGQTFARLLIPYTVDQIRNNVGIHF